MGELLYIKANAKPAGASRTFRISDSFIEAYMQSHPQDKVTTVDLYELNVAPLRTKDINDIFGPKNEESKNHPILKLAYQFAEADKYVVAAPMWNLSIPAILKAYIDYISVVGITFRYTAQGPIGLLPDKKAVHIVSRGGDYSEQGAAAYEMGDRYLRTIFAFFGITDFTTIAADKLDVQGEDIEAIINAAISKAQDTAKNF